MLNNAQVIFAEIVFATTVFLLIYVYLGYPLFVSLLSLLRPIRLPDSTFTPSLSVLIAAHNEESGIEKKLQQTVALDYPANRLEILVLSDGSSDRTDEIVRAFPDPRVRLIRVEPRKGKTNAQNFGVREAKGDVLVFSDATTIYHAQALRKLAANYADPHVGAVSGRYQYFDAAGNSPTGLGSVAFWNYENLIKRAQSRLATISGCCGCIYSVRRNAYTDLNPDIISDLVQPLWVIQKGSRVVFETEALAYEETTQSTQEEFSMRVRVVTRGMRGLLSVPDLFKPWKHPYICFQLVSHKVLRWLVPVFLLILLISNLALVSKPFFAFTLAAQIAFYLSALFARYVPIHRTWKVLGVPLFFCTLNAAALVSLFKLLRGQKYTVWQPVRNPQQ
jgi:cellulose synthase/poly-beta-1,6-N-acetylglucosamine synthase-like glycosyltransferase